MSTDAAKSLVCAKRTCAKPAGYMVGLGSTVRPICADHLRQLERALYGTPTSP